MTKTFIFNKCLISIWDFANAIKINSSDKSNIDLQQFKVMFNNFSKKIIDLQLDNGRLYKFCIKINEDNFNKYYLLELKKNKIKWKNISNTNIRSDKIDKSVKKSMIYWIVENYYLDQLIDFYKLNKLTPQIYLPTNEMLKWISSLPNNFNDIFNN